MSPVITDKAIAMLDEMILTKGESKRKAWATEIQGRIEHNLNVFVMGIRL